MKGTVPRIEQAHQRGEARPDRHPLPVPLPHPLRERVLVSTTPTPDGGRLTVEEGESRRADPKVARWPGTSLEAIS